MANGAVPIIVATIIFLALGSAGWFLATHPKIHPEDPK